MRKLIFKSFVISIFIGFIASILFTTLTATYHAQSELTGIEVTITGIDAIKSMIQEFGFNSLIRLLASHTLIFSISIFIGCVFLGLWVGKSNRDY